MTSLEQHFNDCTEMVQAMASSGSSMGGGPGLYSHDKLPDLGRLVWGSFGFAGSALGNSSGLCM